MSKILGLGRNVALAAAALVMLTGLSGQRVLAATVTVGTCITGGTHYTTIQAAVNAVAAGSTIRVCPGNYPEQVSINKNLTLKGVESGTAFNPVLVVPAGGFTANTSSLTSGDPLAAQVLVESPATDVTISYLAVDGSGNTLSTGCSDPRLIGVFYRNASGTVDYVVTRNQAQSAAYFGCSASGGLGIFVQSSGTSTTSTVTVQNSTIYGYQKNGITANETGTTITLKGNSVVGAGPVNVAQNGIQVAYGATGTIQNNNVADDIFNGDPAAGTASGILIYDAGNLTITGNSVTTTQNGIPIQTDGNQSADGNTITNNEVANTQLGDGIDVCSNGNTLTGNLVFTSGQSGIHLDSSCSSASTGNNNTVNRNVLVDACAGILLGNGTGNTFPVTSTFANVANTTLTGNSCPVVVAADSLVRGLTSSHGANSSHTASPIRP